MALAAIYLAAVVTLSIDCAHHKPPGFTVLRPAGAYRDDPSIARRDPKAIAPMSLTAADGTGISLVRLDARAVLVPPLAYTSCR